MPRCSRSAPVNAEMLSGACCKGISTRVAVTTTASRAAIGGSTGSPATEPLPTVQTINPSATAVFIAAPVMFQPLIKKLLLPS